MSEVAADWHEQMIPQHTMRPSIARVSEQLGPRSAASRHTTAPISHTIRLHPVARKLLLISHPAEGRRLSWPEHTVGYQVWSVFRSPTWSLPTLVSFLTFMFHKVVQWRCAHVVGRLIITLLKIFQQTCHWKNFNNRLIFHKNMGDDKVGGFLHND